MSAPTTVLPTTQSTQDNAHSLIEKDQNKSRADAVNQTTKKRSLKTNENHQSEKKARSSKPTLTHSERIVQATLSKYRPYFSNTNDADVSPTNKCQTVKVSLEYPGILDAESFILMQPVMVNQTGNRQEEVEDPDEYNPISDLHRAAQFMYDYYLDASEQQLLGAKSSGAMRNLTKYRNRRNGPGFVAAVDEFNKVIRDLRAKGALSKHAKAMRHPNYELICFILHQVYSRTVAQQADALNNYQAFSNNVYGEINASLVKEFIAKTNISSRSVFMDLGCGIGNVVLQVAAQTGCESYGIEIMETPCRFAKRQLKEYAARMRAWCFPTGKVHFRHGDFLDTAANDMYTTLKRADVLLVNNYAFDAKTNHALAQLFLDLKEGAKIISLRSFVPKHHKINLRTFHMPESILRVKEFEYFSEAVSWTNNGGMYYIATVDRSRLKPFYERMGN